MFYILYGTNDFLLRQELERIKGSLGDREALALNTSVLDGRRLTPAQLIDVCSTVPFLGNSRLVVVEGLIERFKTSSASRQSDLAEWQAFIDYLPTKPTTTVLVLIDGGISDPNPLLKKVAKLGEVHEFSEMKGTELQQWIQERVAERGGSIAPRALQRLTEVGGENLFVLANEIEKLTVYAGNRRIEEEDVQKVTSFAREANIFAAVDAVVEKRLPVAMRLVHQLLIEGTSPVYLIAMMSRQVCLMIEARELSSQKGLSLEDKRKKLGLSAKYPIHKLLRQSARYPSARLVAIQEKILETDLAIKTGKWQDELALDLLLVEVCS